MKIVLSESQPVFSPFITNLMSNKLDLLTPLATLRKRKKKKKRDAKHNDQQTKKRRKKRGKAATWPDVSSGTKQLWLKSAFLYQFHNQDLGGLVAPLFHAFPSPLFHTHTHT